MDNHECIACRDGHFHVDLRQCPICEEDVCPVCWGVHDRAHYHGPAIVEALQGGDMARVKRLVCDVHGVTPEIVPFLCDPITTPAVPGKGKT